MIFHSGTMAILERMLVLIVVTYGGCGHVVFFVSSCVTCSGNFLEGVRSIV